MDRGTFCRQTGGGGRKRERFGTSPRLIAASTPDCEKRERDQHHPRMKRKEKEEREEGWGGRRRKAERLDEVILSGEVGEGKESDPRSRKGIIIIGAGGKKKQLGYRDLSRGARLSREERGGREKKEGKILGSRKKKRALLP